MTADARNTTVVGLIILSMTVGAAALLWLEPATLGWSRSTLLLAERGRPVHDVLIEYLSWDEPLDAAEFDCLIFSDGRTVWKPRGASVRLVVVGSPADRLAVAQAQALMAVLGNMRQARGLDLRRVCLHPDSDARLRPDLPAQARQLCALLARKGIIR